MRNWLLALCLTLPPVTKATSVVAIWTHDSIVVAVDSKFTYVSDKVAGPSKYSCKIHRNKGFIATIAGMVAYPPTHFNPSDDLDAALAKATDVKHAIDIADRTIVPGFQRALHDFQQRYLIAKYPKMYTENMRNLQYFIGEIVFPGQSVIAYRELAEDKPPQRKDQELARAPTGFANWGYAVFGLREISTAYFTNNPNWFQGAVLPDLAHRLIEQESIANPNDVGGPITVVVLDPNGLHWDPKGLCQDPLPKQTSVSMCGFGYRPGALP